MSGLDPDLQRRLDDAAYANGDLGLVDEIAGTIAEQQAVTDQIQTMYREAAANVHARRTESAAARQAGESRALARTGALYASAVARKCALGEVLLLMGVDPEQGAGPDVPAEDPRPGG
jgi:hypothetical protein